MERLPASENVGDSIPYLRRVFRFNSVGPSTGFPQDLFADLRDPKVLLEGERREVRRIDEEVHKQEVLPGSSLQTQENPADMDKKVSHVLRRTVHAAKPVVENAAKLIPHVVDQLFWKLGTYPIRGSFWRKVNRFYDHPETPHQRHKLKWVLRHSLQDQLPRQESSRLRNGARNILDKNRLTWQIPLWGISLFVPIGPILSIPANVVNTGVAFTHGEIRKGVGYAVLSVLDIAPFALAVAAIPVLHLPLVALGFVAGINFVATFLPTNTMLVERYHNAYTDAYARNILKIVRAETDPAKKLAHTNAIQEFLQESASRYSHLVTVASFTQEIVQNIRHDLEEIGDKENGKIHDERANIEGADHKREQLKHERYSGNIPVVGDVAYFVVKRVRDVSLRARKLLAERQLGLLEEEKDNLVEVQGILSSSQDSLLEK